MATNPLTPNLIGSVSKDWNFKNLPIGGGGYVTGIVMHPLDSNIKYFRTDVGGAYRWNAGKQEWIPMTDFFNWDQTIMYCIDGIAIDPNDKEVVYICCGNPGGSGKIAPAVYKSTNRGETFERTSLEAFFWGNSRYHRQEGECIMVDPNNSDVVYCGTRDKGLMVSYNRGETWENIPSIPLNNDPLRGVRSVCIDPTTVIDGRSKNVYVSVPGPNENFENGVYKSEDGGKTFEKIEEIPTMVSRLSFSNGFLYITTNIGVYKYNGELKEITPNPEILGYRALATSGDRVVVSLMDKQGRRMKLDIYFSLDGGETWSQKNVDIIKKNKTPWWPEYFFSSATASLIFSPDNNKEVWFTDWYGVWMTPDIEKEGTTEWILMDSGHEETVVTDILSNPEGDIELLTSMVDDSGMFYEDINEFPTEIRGGNSTDMDFCEAKPNFVVVTSTENNGTNGAVRVSSDFGRTFEICEGETPTAIRVAYNPKNENNFVVVPLNDVPLVTFDRGKTFKKANGTPEITIKGFWEAPRCICSDRVKENVFYLFSCGGFYRSEDGGENWKLTKKLTECKGAVEAVPGKEGCLYVVSYDGRLFRSKDFGENFEFIDGINAKSLSFGISEDKKDVVIYVLGEIKGKMGLFKSEDELKTLVQLNEESQKLGLAEFIEGDRRINGRVFIGTSGRGIIVAAKRPSKGN